MSGPELPPPVPNAHPLVHFLHRKLVEHRLSRIEVARRAGVGETTLKDWWGGRSAIILQNLEAALEAVGYGLTQQVLPPRVTAADIKVGEAYRVRCGQFAHVTACDGNLISGHLLTGRIALQWNMAGQRIPRGGDDPMDMVLAPAKTREAA